MENLFEISGSLSRITLLPDQASQVLAFFQSIKGDEKKQTALYTYSRERKLAPWFYSRILKLDLSQHLLPQVLALFQHDHAAVEKQNRERNTEALNFLNMFSKQKIDVAILKGNLFVYTVYDDVGYKRMNDFDILVKVEDWEIIRRVYKDLNFIPLGFGWSGEKEKPAKFSHTSIPFISRNFKCIIGTQWGLKSPTTHYKFNYNDLWSEAKNFDFNGVQVKALSPEYNLLHLILHMGVYKIGIRDCMDVYNLMLSCTIDEKKMLNLLERTQASDKAVFTLVLCEACCGKLPIDLVSKLRPSKNSFLMRRLRSRMDMIKERGDIFYSYNDHFQDIEKNVLYFNIVIRAHEKAYFLGMILKQIFFPSLATSLQFIDKPESKSFSDRCRARFMAPYFSFSLIAQEIGKTVTFILFFKLFVDVIASTIRYLFKKESYFEYLRREGLDPDDIIRAVKNVQ